MGKSENIKTKKATEDKFVRNINSLTFISTRIAIKAIQ